MSGLSILDRRFLEAAVRLAVRHEGLTGTNPSVACLLVRDLGHGPVIVGRGITAMGGRPHAEPIAIAEAGNLARGTTAYVTLEPCAHHGRTPPCAEALISAGVVRVVTAVTDPDDRVSGKGHAMLRDAGIEVVEAKLEAARYGLAGYLRKKNTGKPLVTLKLAVSRDGFLGLKGAGQVSITGPESRSQVHLMRALSDAILVGSGTVLEDDPELTCRLPGLAARSPSRIVLDIHARVPETAKLVATALDVPTIIVGGEDQDPDRAGRLRKAGCTLMPPEIHRGSVALPELLDDLGARGFATLMVEGGASVARSFLEEGLVDRIFLFQGSAEIGGSGMGVRSPLNPDDIPTGFIEIDRMHLGSDTCIEFHRKA